MLNHANLIKIIRLINYMLNFAETLFMNNRSLYIIVLFFCLFVTDLPLFGQEVLTSSKIQAKANRKHLPALGLPERANGEMDPVVWYKDGNWRGADSLKADPFWMTETIDVDTVVKAPVPGRIAEFCKEWVAEKPVGPVHIVTGPVRGMQFVAVCTRARSYLNWKSIGFIVPYEGLDPDKGVWDYSCSVNWIEWLTGYDFFPKLPSGLQEQVEEMTSAEHLCSFNEFDPLEFEEPDWEIDYEWEMDMHEIL